MTCPISHSINQFHLTPIPVVFFRAHTTSGQINCSFSIMGPSETTKNLQKRSSQGPVSDEEPSGGPDPTHGKPSIWGNNPGPASDWMTLNKSYYQDPVFPSFKWGKKSIKHRAPSVPLCFSHYLLHSRDPPPGFPLQGNPRISSPNGAGSSCVKGCSNFSEALFQSWAGAARAQLRCFLDALGFP